MSRSRPPRTSRVLLMILGLTVAIGVFTFASQYRRNHPETAANLPAVAATTQDRSIQTSETVVIATPVVTVPASKPATTPTTNVSASAKLPAVELSIQPLVDARAKVDSAELLAARDIYNAALLSGKLSEDDIHTAKTELAAINDVIVFSPKAFPDDAWGGRFTVPPGGALARIAKRFDVTPELLAHINEISDPKRLQAGKSIKILKGPIHAVVDKSDFTLDLYFNSPGGPDSVYITTFSVGLGKDDSTPTGKWLVEPQKKLANPTYYSTRGEGVIDKDDPKNPLGEFWIGLTGVDGQAVGKASYGIHGTIEPDSIGKMDSMGCIRLRDADIARVYALLVEGKSTVVVQD
jgi:lipoprotein-anchoring transpeptidase ErfK/SrfK